MWKLLSLLQRNLVWSIPISMACGLLYGYLFNAGALKQFIIPVTFIMVYPMMTTLNVKSVFKGHDYKLQVTTQLINFILIPIVAYYVGKVFFGGGPEKYGLWAVGLFLIGVLPTSGMTISWTGFAKGNKEAAIKMVVFGLVIGAAAAPVYTKVFMGATVDVDMLHMFKQIAIFVFVPFFAGLATQAYARKKFGEKQWHQKIKPKFPPISALGVVLIAFVAMSLKAKHIIANPGDILTILVPLAVFYLISYGFLSLAGRVFFKREDAIAMVFGVVMRDLSIALAIAMTAFGKQGITIALLIALAYVIQIQSAAWYVRFVEKIFGKAAPKEALPAAGDAPAKAPVEPAGSGLAGAAERRVPDIRKILYATDLSETARHAVRYACSIGHRYQAQVSLLHVIPDLVEEFSSGAGINLKEHMQTKDWERFNEKGVQQAHALIAGRIRETSQQLKQEMPECPVSKEHAQIRIGNPAREILTTIKEGAYDMVIMGTHGHGKFEEAMIGSIAGEVIRKSPVPVLVVRLPDTDQQNQPVKEAA